MPGFRRQEIEIDFKNRATLPVRNERFPHHGNILIADDETALFAGGKTLDTLFEPRPPELRV